MLEVIGSGMGRTGTFSLKTALEILGFGPCYHMFDIIEEPQRIEQWSPLVRGEGSVDFGEVFDGYRATVDWPGCYYWRAILRRFPAAKVVLTTRNPDTWYRSMVELVHVAERTGYELAAVLGSRRTSAAQTWQHMQRLDRFITELIWDGAFDGRFGDPEHAKAVFERHNESVCRSAPAGQLLIFTVTDGWGPLCEFLGVDIPDTPFPRLNDVESYRAKVHEIFTR
ncbi:MAG: sulfotransferase family protein [Pseudonocardiales bacterium]|nr:sulfotransferase family protein [Pseudonocardiales bacterium]